MFLSSRTSVSYSPGFPRQLAPHPTQHPPIAKWGCVERRDRGTQRVLVVAVVDHIYYRGDE